MNEWFNSSSHVLNGNTFDNSVTLSILFMCFHRICTYNSVPAEAQRSPWFGEIAGCSHVIRFTRRGPRGQPEMQKQLSVELSIHDIYIYLHMASTWFCCQVMQTSMYSQLGR